MIGDIARVLQCMASHSFVSKVSRTTSSTTSSVTVRGTPGRGRAAQGFPGRRRTQLGAAIES